MLSTTDSGIPEFRYAASRHPTADSAFERYRRTGDADALSEVVRETTSSLLRAATSLARDDDTAEDLVQSTFVAAIAGARRYDPSHPVVPWLLGILGNRARRLRRDAARAPDPDRLPREVIAPDPREAAIARELRREVERAISRLPETYRSVVDLSLRHGLTPREIAQALQRSRSTVRTQLARGLSHLREDLRFAARFVG